MFLQAFSICQLCSLTEMNGLQALRWPIWLWVLDCEDIDQHFEDLYCCGFIVTPISDCWAPQQLTDNPIINSCTMRRNWPLLPTGTTWMNPVWLSIETNQHTALADFVSESLARVKEKSKLTSGILALFTPSVLSWRSGRARCSMHSLHHLAKGMCVNLCLAWVASSGICATLCPYASLVSWAFASLTQLLAFKNSIFLLWLRICV